LSRANFVSLEAAASFGTGYIHIDQYQDVINDILRRSGVLGRRIQNVQATGALSQWFDQTSMTDAAFDTPTALAPAVGAAPTRAAKSLAIKAITGRVQFGLFNQQVADIGLNRNLQAKDTVDMLNAVVRTHDKALWQGTDTVSGAQVGSGATNQYVGLGSQISNAVVVVASGSSIVDAIRLEVAKMVADPVYDIRPTAIYLHPLAVHLIENELKATNNTIAQVEVVAGVKVNAIMTAAGLLPLIPDFDIAADPSWASAAPGGSTNYPAFIVTEPLIEYHWVGSPGIQVFTLGEVSDLKQDIVAVKFGAPVAKLANKAHKRMVIQHTTL
jgi:hypothetical protein